MAKIHKVGGNGLKTPPAAVPITVSLRGYRWFCHILGTYMKSEDSRYLNH